MNMWRSLLFVPANRQKMLDKLGAIPADGFIFDLEDTVPAEEKAHARQMAADCIAQLPADRCWVRVNGIRSGFLHEDLDAFVGQVQVAGFVLPKQDTAADVAAVDRMLASLEASRGMAVGSIPVIAMIESASGVLFAHQIMTASSRVASAVYAGGQDGDMNVSLGATWSSEGPEMMFARQMTLLSARAADIPCPLDGVYANIADPAGFERDTQLSQRLGFRGRTVIHPSQVEAANRIYMPSEADIAYYTRVLQAFEDALGRGTASTTVDGKLVDVAMAANARRVLDLVAAYQRK
ncbi:aldolase/citrate lyase family protein [Pigmentiphaga soli]|uniref:Aldolase/citrate lyase family protein n=1 Tax=Pigmentiphaga soli TaxID=1007095 RepID=A0ABP8H3D7_9BURK